MPLTLLTDFVWISLRQDGGLLVRLSSINHSDITSPAFCNVVIYVDLRRCSEARGSVAVKPLRYPSKGLGIDPRCCRG